MNQIFDEYYISCILYAISFQKVEHEKVVSISKLSTDELIAAMRNEDFTCEEVLHAFQCKVSVSTILKFIIWLIVRINMLDGKR